MSIGENLYALRREAGLTQVEIAEITGIQNCDISNYERDRKSPRVENLIKLADCFGCTLEDIVGYTPKRKIARYAEIDDTFEQMLISAERYAQDRQTYIVDITAKFVQSLLPKLSDKCLRILFDDLLKRKMPFAQTSDGEMWDDLLREIESERDERYNAAETQLDE